MAHARVSALVAVLLPVSGLAQHGAVDGEWRAYNGDNGATKYSPLDQIDAGNAARLGIVWRRPAVDASILAQVPDLRYGASYRATPLMIDGVLYAPNGIGFVEAFDAGTGATLWVEAPLDEGPNRYAGTVTRGVAYWTDGEHARIPCRAGNVGGEVDRGGTSARTIGQHEH